jgi:hypothetical protein
VTELPDLSCLSHDEKNALIRALWAQVQVLTAQVQTLTAPAFCSSRHQQLVLDMMRAV